MPITVDVAIVGGGPGGYTAAIRAAQAGKSVLLIEKDKLGGICLHKGCIPSKVLLRSAEVYSLVKEAVHYGINVPNEKITADWSAIHSRKTQIIAKLYEGLTRQIKQYGIRTLSGHGRIVGPSIFSPRGGSVVVEQSSGEVEQIVPRNIVLASGSSPLKLPDVPYDGTTIGTSDDALTWTTLPQSILIVGGGVIGIEWASLLSDFGVQVTIVEQATRLLPAEDEAIGQTLEKILLERGVKIFTATKLQPGSFSVSNDQVQAVGRTDDETCKLIAQRMLVTVGRTANWKDLGLENTSIKIEKDCIQVNPETMQTAEPDIYAIGDCVGGNQLAHAAMHQASIAIDHLIGAKSPLIPSQNIPRAIYSRPEVAAIGWTEQEAEQQGFSYKTLKFPMDKIGKSLVQGTQEGFIKVIVDANTDNLLGLHCVGAHVTELISEMSLAMFVDASPWEIGRTIHPHPTLSEAMQAAMQAINLRNVT